METAGELFTGLAALGTALLYNDGQGAAQAEADEVRCPSILITPGTQHLPGGTYVPTTLLRNCCCPPHFNVFASCCCGICLGGS